MMDASDGVRIPIRGHDHAAHLADGGEFSESFVVFFFLFLISYDSHTCPHYRVVNRSVAPLADDSSASINRSINQSIHKF
jgi:hypothetical protein